MRETSRLAVLLVILAIGVRVASVLVLQSHQVPHSTYEHGEIAKNLLQGRGFSIRLLGAEGPTSQQAPVYPFLVAAAYLVGGIETPESLLILELAQAVLGGLLTVGVIALAREVTKERSELAVLMAGFVAATYPPLVYAATHVQVALLAATLVVWTLAWGYRTSRTGSARDGAVTGGLLALLALTDPILALTGVGVIWAIATSDAAARKWSLGTARLCGIILLTTAAGVTPWTIRNAMVHGELVAIKSSFGYAFWQGNCAISEGTDKVVRPSVEKILSRDPAGADLASINRTLWEARHEAGYIDDIALTSHDLAVLGSVSEPERARILFRRALSDLAVNPTRYFQLCACRFQYFWLFDETNPKTRILLYRVSHLSLLALAILGLVRAGGETRTRLRPTIATVLLISLFHTMTIVSARFHLPIEPLMAVWAGLGIAWIVEAARSLISTAARDDVERLGVELRLDRG